MNRILKDRLATRFMLLITVFSTFILFFLILVLFIKSIPILTANPLSELFFSSSWRPFKGEFGFYPFIIGTIWVTALAMVIAIPISLLSAIYLAEYAPAKVQHAVSPFIDLLAGIPSVVYGVWGLLILVPIVGNIASLFVDISTGYSVLAGGIVLTIMVFPIIISLLVEVFSATPRLVREVSIALGATKWQTVKHVVLRMARRGIVAAILLGFGRAFGETMAVLMVVGNVPQVPSSIFEPAYPLTALIANNYGEMMSIPLYDSALLFGALILLFIVISFNVLARLFLLKIERGYDFE